MKLSHQMSDLFWKQSIVKSFTARPFNPSIFRGNNHYQTIFGSEAIRVKLFGSYPRSFKTKRERITTPDGDFFDVDFTSNCSIDDDLPIVLILHGLESNSEGPLVTKMASSYLSKGFCCCLVSFRSCSGEDNITPGAYHLGFTDDIDHLIRNVIKPRFSNKKIYISGFSLGGNVVLKYLGELGDEASSLNVAGAAVTCVPFDPVASQGKLDKGFNRAIYSMNFLSTLKRKAERQSVQFPGLFDIEKIRKCDKIGDFDDLFIAKIYGFADKTDYYRKTGSKWWLNKIRVPTIAINARDDPFIEESSLPEAEDVGESPVKLVYHDKGGHCGFLSSEESSPHGWLAEELGRALKHIHSNINSNYCINLESPVVC